MSIYGTIKPLVPPAVRRALRRSSQILNLFGKTKRKPQFDGAHSKRWWATRDQQTSSAPGFWESRTNPLRTEIGKVVASLDAKSILEVGCHAGMNLWSAAQFRKWEKIAGTEISPTVLDFTRKTLPTAVGQGVDLYEGSADALPFPDDSFDVVLSSVMLVCVGPEEIEQVLSEICRVARKWIVLVEPLEIDPRFATPAGREDPYPNTMYWIRDYSGLLKDRAETISITALPHHKQMGHANSIIILKRY